MLSIFNKRSRNLLGIDISSSSIKLLELSKQGDKYRVEHYATRPLPVGAVVEKNIANVEAVGEEILKLSTLVKTKTTDAAVAVSGASVIAKTIEMVHRLLLPTLSKQKYWLMMATPWYLAAFTGKKSLLQLPRHRFWVTCHMWEISSKRERKTNQKRNSSFSSHLPLSTS